MNNVVYMDQWRASHPKNEKLPVVPGLETVPHLSFAPTGVQHVLRLPPPAPKTWLEKLQDLLK